MHRTSGPNVRYASIVYIVPISLPGWCVYIVFGVSDLSRSIVQPLARSWYIIWYNVLIVRQTLVSKIPFGVLVGLFYGYVHIETFGGFADELHVVGQQMELANDLQKRWGRHEPDAFWQGIKLPRDDAHCHSFFV